MSPWAKPLTLVGWTAPGSCPRAHAITPTGGHLDPTMFQALGPDVLPITVEEGVADGIDEIRRAVRYQIKYGAQSDQMLPAPEG